MTKIKLSFQILTAFFMLWSVSGVSGINAAPPPHSLAATELSNQEQQQTRRITGTVRDRNDEPIIGANVQVAGTSNGTMTDVNGQFSLEVPANATLRISSIGYIAREVQVGNQSSLDISLDEDLTVLDEVVVVGYGVQRKSDVTGALAVVSSKELTSKPVSNALEALQGKAAGVRITSNQRPGELGSVRVRGVRSLTASNDPLYVVDGMILGEGGIGSINTMDIESISVLKDASSTAIYGSRGANGVVLVTTKKGEAGKFSINYSGSLTTEKRHDLQPSMNADEYMTWLRWAMYNAKQDLAPGNQPSYANDMLILSQTSFPESVRNNILKGWEGGTWNPANVINTDWGDMVTQSGLTQTHTLSVSGGTDRLKSYVSIGYLDNEGTTKGQAYQRYNFTASTDITATKWFTMGGSINAAWSNQDFGFARGMQSFSSRPDELYTTAKRIPNVALPYDDNGNRLPEPASYSIFSTVDEWKYSTDQRQVLRALGNFYAGLDFGKMWEPLQGLKYKITFGPDIRQYRRGRYIDEQSSARLASGAASIAYLDNQRDFSWVLNNIVSYSREIDIHTIDLTLIQEASKSDRETSNMSATGIEKPSYIWNAMGSVPAVTDGIVNIGIGSGIRQSQIASYGFRVNYGLMDKYLLTVSGRYDGSSVLAPGNKWAFFPSAALGWRIDREKFMQDLNWLNQLKLRAGVGITGNSAVSPYQTKGDINQFYTPFGGMPDAIVFVPNEPFFTATITRMANLDLSWEKTTQWNVGLDFSVLRGRVNGSIDVYASNTNDLIMDMAIPSITGYTQTYANVGKTKNKGVDISLNFVPVETSGFTWVSTVNAAWSKDEIVELANGKQDMVDNSWFIGKPLSIFYGFDTDGLWKESDAEEMKKFNDNGTNFSAGMVKPVDQPDENGERDYVINEKDRVVLGNQNPNWNLGWNNSFRYKDIELNVDLYGCFGYMVNTGGQWQAGVNQNKIDYWTPDNTDAEWQKPSWGEGVTPGDPYSGPYGYKNAAFLKLRNLSLGYYLPKKYCKTVGLSNLKIYVQGRNLGNILSTVDFLDLDYNSTDNTNNIVSFYNRGLTFGLDISF